MRISRAFVGLPLLCASIASGGECKSNPGVRVAAVPNYPTTAQGVLLEGIVQVDAVIDTDGDVTDVRYRSGHIMLMYAAMEAVRGWRFGVGENERCVTITFKFTLVGSGEKAESCLSLRAPFSVEVRVPRLEQPSV
jgi:TonB family protein